MLEKMNLPACILRKEKVVNLKILELGGPREQVGSQSWVDYETWYWPI